MQFLPRGGHLGLDSIDTLQIDSISGSERRGGLAMQDAPLGDFESLGFESTFALQQLERSRIHPHRSSLWTPCIKKRYSTYSSKNTTDAPRTNHRCGNGAWRIKPNKMATKK